MVMGEARRDPDIRRLQQKRWQKRADRDSAYRGTRMGLMHKIDDTY
jgi:hypothetical protein